MLRFTSSSDAGRLRLPRWAIGCFGAILAFTGYSVPAVAADDQVLEEVVVTGSRIARKNLIGSSAVLEFDRDDIQRSGEVSLGELIRDIPSVAGAGQTTQVNNGGTGAQTISLRGLGSQRTLVLMNGRRLPASGVSASATGLAGIVDLNTVPVAMVERIEVLQDGASAVYGSDAIGGVVNIITRRDFDGIELSSGYGQTSEDDGERRDISLTFGNSWEGGNFIFDATYVEEEAITAADRDWANVPLAALNGDVIFLGSSAPPWGNYATSAGNLTLGPDYAGGAGLAGFRAFDFFGGDSYNFAPINHQRQPNERYMFTFQGTQRVHAISDALGTEVRVFADAQYVSRDSERALAEVPLAPLVFFGFDAPYAADNFYNPFGEEIGDWRRRMVEGGPRVGPDSVETKRVMLGLEGEHGAWRWEAYYSYGDTDRQVNFGDIYNLNRVANAVGPTTGSLAGGDLACVNDAANCVPLDVFGENSVTQDMLDYITFTTNERAGQTQKVWAFNVSNGELFELPGGPLGMAVGFEYRDEEGFDQPDSQVAALADAGATTGTPRNATSGGYDVTEVYAELLIPILSGVPGAEELELEVAHRYSDYSTFGDTNNTKLGIRWRPFSDLLVRATRSEAFRAPQISDLFGGTGTSFPALTDPCSTNSTAFCQADGVPAAGYVPLSQQIRTQVGGNPTLQPETADIFTVGVVFTPSFWEPLEPLSITVDYYEIELEDAINPLGADFILGQCANAGLLCDRIERFTVADGAALAGNIRNLDNRTANVGGVDLSGVDISLGYDEISTPIGMFEVIVNASYIEEYEIIQGDGSRIVHDGRFIDDQDGWFGHWKASTSLRWTYGDFSGNWDMRWIKGATETYNDFALGAQERHVAGRFYNDLQFTYERDVAMGRAGFTIGVENVFDTDPPLSLDGFNDNTDVRTFDTAGRYMYGRISFSM